MTRSSRATSRRSGTGSASTCTATAASSHRRRRSSVRSGRRRSTPCLTFSTCARSCRGSTSSPRSVVPILAAALASFAIIGADSRWLVALGPTFAHSLPFATAATSGWHDVPVLAQAVFHALDALFGDRGLILAQMAAAFVGFALLARGVRSDLVLVFVMIGSLPLLLVVHAELFSLALMPLMLLLLEEERWNLWLAVPLLAVWSNLHGSVLVGLALLLVYVAVSHRGRWPVAVCGVAAVCLTPALWNTPAYYVGVARNEAARRGVGFWHPLDLRPFDLLLVACVVVLVAVGRRRYRGWEAVAAIGLATATIHAERLGVWLLFLTAYPPGRAVRTAGVPRRYVPALAVAFAALAVAG